MPDLLIELFSEEIPARMQARAAQALKEGVTNGLVEAGLTYAGAVAHVTPRRLVLAVSDLLAQSPTTVEERKGPRVDAPEKALAGFLRSTGLTQDQLTQAEDKKGAVWMARIERAGRPAEAIVAEVLEATIRNFPWPKSMRWGTGALRWVRPLHSILCILSDEEGARVVEMDVDGIRAGNTTRGHRFMAQQAITVTSFDDYTAALSRAYVMLDAAERAAHIKADAENMAFASRLELVEDPGLLAEVAGLVEWPVVLMGKIDDAFLSLPAEVLQTSMREHQKFFSLRNPSSGQIERFVTVANRLTDDDGATILAGNQKVLAARLSDAAFFWENDLRVAKAGMADWAGSLDNVTFHNKLGTQGERVRRIADLAGQLAPQVGADAADTTLAAQFAKADLASEMVYEFPELQGVMGRYYASHAGLVGAAAHAAEEHYAPLGPSDDVPTAPVSVAVALADKLDLLTGFWAIDEKPTGSKDPFALRRAALGVIRIITDNALCVPLSPVIDVALARHEGEFEGVGADLLGFIHDRLKVYLRDKGIRHDVIDACLAMEGADDLALLVRRAQALSDGLKTDDGANLIQGFRRANNILTAEEAKDGVEYSYGADVKFAEHDAERALFAALDAAEAEIAPALQSQDFVAAVAVMAGVRAPIDAFFDAVQVNAENAVLRRNRLNLLHRIRAFCSQIADLSRIEGG